MSSYTLSTWVLFKTTARNSKVFIILFLGVILVLNANFSAQTIDNDRNSNHNQKFASLEAESSRIMPAEGTLTVEFGTSVAMDGDTLIVGAPRERNAENVIRGAAYIFVRNGAGWTQQAKLVSNAATTNFGFSVALSGDTAIVGAHFENIGSNSNQGAAYVFVRNGAIWTMEQKLVNSDGVPGSQFGYSVAIDGNTVLISAFAHRISNVEKGAAYVFTKVNNTWTQQIQLTDGNGNIYERFGNSVALDGDTAIIGAPFGRNEANVHNGVAYVFTGSGSAWTQQARLVASDARGDEWFGTSVDIDGDTVIIGARYGFGEGSTNPLIRNGSAYVFTRNESNWTQQQKFTAPNSSFFGDSVSISGDTLIIGSPHDQIGKTTDQQGSAYVFIRKNNQWIRQSRLISPDDTISDYFGTSVSANGNKFIVGAPGFDNGTNGNQGAAYFFITPPFAPDLQVTSDSGISSTDNITKLRNLSFDIGGLTTGSTAELLRDGVVVSSALVNGNSATLTDADVPANGNFKYTTRQIVDGEVSSHSEVTTVTIDTIAPTVTINQSSSFDPTNNHAVGFKAVFSETVIGFNASDLSFVGSTADISQANVNIYDVTENGSTYFINIFNIIANNQAIIASVPAEAASDTAGNFNLASTSTDNTVTIDNVRPTVTINQAAGQIDPTTTFPIHFTVVFSEPVTGLTNNGISLIGSTAYTGGAVISITGSGTTYNVTVSGFNSNGQLVRASVDFGAARDSLGNGNIGSTSTDNTITVDNVRPTVTINQAIGQSDPTSTEPLNYRVVFSETVTGFDSADVSLAGSTANTSAANIVITGSGATYNVAVSNIVSSGQVRASLIADAALDALGNPSNISTSSDNTITFILRRIGFDFDGDRKSDISVFRPSTGSWYLLQSSNNSFLGQSFGISSDIITPADYDGDGKTDFAVFRSDNGTWYLQQSTNGFTAIQFGQNGDIPVPADYDGDGEADIAVYRPSAGSWYRLNSSNGQFVAVQFGTAEDKPTIGDFDGDGKADIAVFRPSTGSWYRLNSSNNQFFALQFGVAEDKPTPADYDGDGKTDIAVFRPSTGGWYRLNSSNGEFVAVGFGISEDRPVPADYDGDGKADVAVFRPSEGNWYLLRSTAGFTAVRFGAGEDEPIPNAFVQ